MLRPALLAPRNVSPTTLWLSSALGAVACAVVTTGCGDYEEINHVSWEPLTATEAVTRLQQPSGLTTSAIDPQVVLAVEQRLSFALQATRFLAQVAATINAINTPGAGTGGTGPDGEPLPASPSGEWGTSFYLGIACPGPPTSTPPFLPVLPFDFANGEVRLDSAELQTLDLSSLQEEGDFLLTFSNCNLGGIVLNGEVPGHYVADTAALGLGLSETGGEPRFGLAFDFLDLDYGGTQLPFGVLGFSCSAVSSCLDDMSVALEVDTGETGTYVLAFSLTAPYWLDPGMLMLEARAGDGEASCTFTASPYAPSVAPSLNCATSQ